MNNPDFNSRRSIRLAGYDYTLGGAYFITICAREKRCVFGRVVDGEMRLNDYGLLAQQEWNGLPEHFAQVELDIFQIMPNHAHAIIIVSSVGAASARPETLENQLEENILPVGDLRVNRAGEPRPYKPTLGQIVAYFKYQNTKRINAYRNESTLAPVRVWQRNYYERIIRNERELNDTRRYIIENPMNWERDRENPTTQL